MNMLQSARSQAINQLQVQMTKRFLWNSMILLRADEEPVDQKKYLEDRCQGKSVKPLYEYRACMKRIQDDETGHKHCTGQYFDYWSCIDKCVAEKLFNQLK